MEVFNANGTYVDYDAATNLMDAKIIEELHNHQDWRTEQQFFTAYERAHKDKYGEEWELSKATPVW